MGDLAVTFALVLPCARVCPVSVCGTPIVGGLCCKLISLLFDTLVDVEVDLGRNELGLAARCRRSLLLRYKILVVLL